MRNLGLTLLGAGALLAALWWAGTRVARAPGAPLAVESGEPSRPVESALPPEVAPVGPSAALGVDADTRTPAPLQPGAERAPRRGALVGVLHGRVRTSDGAVPSTAALARASASLAYFSEPAALLPDGTFEFAALLPKLERLTLTVPGYQSVEAPVRIEAGRTAELELVLPPGVRVSGRVLDEAGTALGGVRVDVTSTPEDEHGPGSAHMDWLTDELGRFELPGVSAGVIELRASREGRRPVRLALGALAVGDARDGLELVLPRGSALAGRVWAPDGKPAAGAELLAFDALAAEEWQVPGGSVPGGVVNHPSPTRTGAQFSARADGEGRFRLEGLSAGPFRVWAWSGGGPNAEPDSAPAATALASAARVPAEALELELHLAVAGALALDLRGRTGEYLPEVRVVDLEGADPGVRAHPFGNWGLQGTWRPSSVRRATAEGLVLLDLEPGERWLVVTEEAMESTEFRTGRARATVLSGETVRVALTLEPGAALAVTLVRGGAPVAGVVTVRADDGFALRLGLGPWEDQAEPTRRAWLPPGRYRVEGELDGRRGKAEVTLSARETRDLRLELE